MRKFNFKLIDVIFAVLYVIAWILAISVILDYASITYIIHSGSSNGMFALLLPVLG